MIIKREGIYLKNNIGEFTFEIMVLTFDFWLWTLNWKLFLCICFAFRNFHMEVDTVYRVLLCTVVCLHATNKFRQFLLSDISSLALLNSPVAAVLSSQLRQTLKPAKSLKYGQRNQAAVLGEGRGAPFPHFVFWGAASTYRGSGWTRLC